MRCRQCGVAVTAAALASMMVPGAAAAAPLDKAACAGLEAELKALRSGGIEKVLAEGSENGPGWALANITLNDIERIKRYLALEDDIRFRCPGVDLPAPPVENQMVVPAAAKAGSAGSGIPMPSRRPEPPAKNGKSAALGSGGSTSN